MGTGEPLFRLSVYVDDEDDLALARRILEAVDPGSVRVTSGIVSGLATESAAREIRDAGLLANAESRAKAAPSLPGTGSGPDVEEVHDFALKLHSFLYDTPGAVRLPDAAGRRKRGTGGEDDGAGDVRSRGGGILDRMRGRLRDASGTLLGRLGGVPIPGGPADEDEDAAGEEGDVYEVEFDRRLDDEIREELDRSGLTILSHRPPDVYRLYLDARQLERVRALPFVRRAERYGPEATVEDRVVLLLGEPAPGAEGGAGPRPETFDLVVHRAADLPRVRALVESEPDAEVLDASEAALRFRMPVRAPFLAGLAQLPEVAVLDVYVPPRLSSDVARGLLGVDALAAPGGVAWDGTGEVVAVFDSGVDATHPDFGDRLVRRRWGRGSEDDVSGHGTHVAGIVAGDGTASGGAVRGVAPGARLVSVGIAHGPAAELDLPVDLRELLALAREHRATIVNLSWGEATGTRVGGLGEMRLPGARYDRMAYSVDQFVYENPEMLVVVAAGNEGTAPDGTPAFFRVCTPATAKNVLTVGASLGRRPEFADRTWGRWRGDFKPPAGDVPMAGDPDDVALLSSPGPTQDRIIKPDVVAPGTFILAARARDAGRAVVWEPFPVHTDGSGREWYCYAGGTSMAAPVVSGAAAVVRQYLREAARHASPSAALLKAVLVASASPIRSRRPEPQRQAVGFPDFDQGFGRVDLRNVLPHADAPAGRKLLFADVPNGGAEGLVSGPRPGSGKTERRVYTVSVPAGATAPLRVVLTWTDQPDPGAQNRLQLLVRRPDGTREAGNDGHRFGRDEGLGLLQPDWRNTVKRVDLAAPAPGVYRIMVLAENTLVPSQGYALVVCGEMEEDSLA